MNQKQRNQLNYKVMVADYGMETVRDQWGEPKGEQRLKFLQVINMFTGRVEEYKLTENYNRVKYVKDDGPQNALYDKDEYTIMNDYCDNMLGGNGYHNANIVKDVIEGNREDIEKYIENEVQFRLQEELRKRGIE